MSPKMTKVTKMTKAPDLLYFFRKNRINELFDYYEKSGEIDLIVNLQTFAAVKFFELEMAKHKALSVFEDKFLKYSRHSLLNLIRNAVINSIEDKDISKIEGITMAKMPVIVLVKIKQENNKPKCTYSSGELKIDQDGPRYVF